jgi:hypothetical protein
VRCIEELGRLKDHFDNVLVTVPARTARGLVGQIEDVHSGAWGLCGDLLVSLGPPAAAGSNFPQHQGAPLLRGKIEGALGSDLGGYE